MQIEDCRPVVFLKNQHSHEEIEPFYEGADPCMVTSLHDGGTSWPKSTWEPKEVFGGIEVHRESWQVTVRKEGKELFPGRIAGEYLVLGACGEGKRSFLRLGRPYEGRRKGETGDGVKL